MALHHSTFKYVKPSDEQIDQMQVVRDAAAEYARVIEENVPAGPDLTYALRKLREVAMWVNVAIHRQPDGSPR